MLYFAFSNSRFINRSSEVVERHWPPLKPVEAAERYVLKPLYTVFPKPGGWIR